MADRWPVVLEAFGLVAALEDLAERSRPTARRRSRSMSSGPAIARRRRSSGRPGGSPRSRSTTPSGTRAPTTIAVTVAVDAATLRLVVADDGPGFEPAIPVGRAPAARRLDPPRRDVGASVRVEPGRRRDRRHLRLGATRS